MKAYIKGNQTSVPVFFFHKDAPGKVIFTYAFHESKLSILWPNNGIHHYDTLQRDPNILNEAHRNKHGPAVGVKVTDTQVFGESLVGELTAAREIPLISKVTSYT
jgi:hypothetical protein